MLEIANQRPRRSVYDGGRYLVAAVVLVLGIVAFAGTAHASTTGESSGAGSGEAIEGATGSVAAETTEVSATTAPEEHKESAIVLPVETPVGTGVVITPELPAATGATPPAEKLAEPVGTQPSEKLAEAVHTEAVHTEAVHTGPGSEEGHEGLLSSHSDPPVYLEATAAAVVPVADEAGVVASAQEATGPLAGSLTGASVPAGSGRPKGPTGGAAAGAAASRAARRAVAANCELSALGGHKLDNCAAGWLGEKRFASASSAGSTFVQSSSEVAATERTPSQGGHGGSAGGGAPVSPAPGGASGAPAGGSGLALSTLLTLAGLLLLGAPRAMRRLRLSCEPWLTACFVLIPERPG